MGGEGGGGRGQFEHTFVVFPVTFNVIVSYIFFENLIEIP